VRGDKSGYETEFREYMVSRWGNLVRFAYGLTGDRGHAEDLAQTALAKAYASWPRVRRAEDPDAYVRRILINANHGRFRKRRVEENSGEAPTEPAVADGTAAVDERAALMAALMELPPKQREVITLRDVEGWSSAEVREALDLSEANQRVLLHRARAKVRARLEEYLDEAAA